MISALLLLLSCDGPAPATAPIPEPAPAPPIAPPAPRETLSWSALPQGDLAPPAADPRAFDQRVLVILSSSLTPGAQPAGLDQVAALPDAAPARLDSTWFKGLMPCYEIVVAGGFVDIASARALSTQLKAKGVDHYLKRAGAYTGDRPELASACAAMRAPAQGDARFALIEGPGARLPLDSELETRILEGAPKVSALDPRGEAWGAPLPVQTVDRWSKGQTLTGLSFESGPIDCTIQEFAVGITGTPHFGWYEGDRRAPGCGSPHVYAALDCQADLLLAPGTSGGSVAAKGPAVEVPAPTIPAAWSPRVAAERAAAKAAATAQGTAWSERWTARPFDVGTAALQLIQLVEQSGEGNWMCGQDEHFVSLVGLLGPDGTPLGPLFEASGWDPVGLVAPDGTGHPAIALREEITGSLRLISEQLDLSMDLAYCDCPC